MVQEDPLPAVESPTTAKLLGPIVENGDLDVSLDGGAVQNFLEVLERHRIQCEQQGKYDEADLAKRRLEQLRAQEENRRKEEMMSEQLSERLGVEEAHMKELQEFNQIWDARVAEYEAHAANLQSTLAERHKQERSSFLEKAQDDLQPRKPRWSRELLNIRKIQETQAKMKDYKSAASTKELGDRMADQEKAAWEAKRYARLQGLDKQFCTKQKLEMGGLVKRIQSGREEQKQARKTELERLLQRYHNVKTQLESQQALDKHRAAKYSFNASMSMMSTRGASRQSSRFMSSPNISGNMTARSANGYPGPSETN